MSIPIVENPSITYVGDGVNKEWAYPYDFADYRYIKLLKINSEGESIKITSDYTYKPNTKSFIYPVNEVPLTSEEKIVLYRETPIKQSSVLPNLYPYNNIMDTFDYVIMILQEQNILSKEGIKRYDELKAEFKELKTHTESELKRIEDKVLKELVAVQEEISAKLKEQEDRLNAQMLENNAEVKKAIALVNETKAFLLGELAKTKEEVKQELASNQADTLNKVKVELNETTETINTNMNALTESVNTSITQLSNEVDRRLDSATAEMNDMIEQGKVIIEATSDIDERLQENHDYVDKRIEEVGVAQFEKRVASLETQVPNKEDKGVAKRLTDTVSADLDLYKSTNDANMMLVNAQIERKEDKGVAQRLITPIQSQMTVLESGLNTKENKGVAQGLIAPIQEDVTTLNTKVSTLETDMGDKLSKSKGGRIEGAVTINNGLRASHVYNQFLATDKPPTNNKECINYHWMDNYYTPQVKQTAETLDKAVVGTDTVGSFPLSSATVDGIYKAPNNRYYKCITAWSGGTITVPNANFEEVSLLANGGGEEKWEKLSGEIGSPTTITLPQPRSKYKKLVFVIGEINKHWSGDNYYNIIQTTFYPKFLFRPTVEKYEPTYTMFGGYVGNKYGAIQVQFPKDEKTIKLLNPGNEVYCIAIYGVK